MDFYYEYWTLVSKKGPVFCNSILLGLKLEWFSFHRYFSKKINVYWFQLDTLQHFQICLSLDSLRGVMRVTMSNRITKAARFASLLPRHQASLQRDALCGLLGNRALYDNNGRLIFLSRLEILSTNLLVSECLTILSINGQI